MYILIPSELKRIKISLVVYSRSLSDSFKKTSCSNLFLVATHPMLHTMCGCVIIPEASCVAHSFAVHAQKSQVKLRSKIRKATHTLCMYYDWLQERECIYIFFNSHPYAGWRLRGNSIAAFGNCHIIYSEDKNRLALSHSPHTCLLGRLASRIKRRSFNPVKMHGRPQIVLHLNPLRTSCYWVFCTFIEAARFIRT